jgi:hypothetical protein
MPSGFGGCSFRGVPSPGLSLEKKGEEPVPRSLSDMVDLRYILVDIISPAMTRKP